MKALLAFSSGGSGFPGSPVAGVYFGFTSGEFLAICAEVVSFTNSVVLNFSAGSLIWASNGSDMFLLGGSVSDITGLPTPGTAGGVTFIINSDAAIFNQDNSEFYYFDGAIWVSLS